MYSISELMSRNLVPIRVSLSTENMHRDVVVTSGYFSEDREAPPEELRRLTEYCSGKYLPLLILCDANAHSIVCGELGHQ